MTCDRIWRNCFIKHLNLPCLWRNTDADKLTQPKQDIFWVDASFKGASYLVNFVKDIDHRIRIETMLKYSHNGAKGIHFIVSRSGDYIQYYPYLSFNDSGIAWEHIQPITFYDFDELNKKCPPVRYFAHPSQAFDC